MSASGTMDFLDLFYQFNGGESITVNFGSGNLHVDCCDFGPVEADLFTIDFNFFQALEEAHREVRENGFTCAGGLCMTVSSPEPFGEVTITPYGVGWEPTYNGGGGGW